MNTKKQTAENPNLKVLSTKKPEINLDEVLDRINQLKIEIAHSKFVLKQCELELEKEELRLQAVLKAKNKKEMIHGVFSFGWVKKTRKAFDQKLFGEAHPKLLEKFKIEKETESFEIKINK